MKDEHKTKAQLIEELKQVRQGIIALKESETKRKCAEEELRESDEQYRRLAESLPDLVYEFDLEGKFMYVNEAASHLFGYSQDEMLNDILVYDTVIEEDRVHLRKAIHDILKGKTAVGERTLVRKDGSTFIGEIHSGPIYEGKDVVGVRGILRDITERKLTQEALYKSEKRFRDLADLLPDAVYEIDLKGKFTFANQKAFQVSGYSREDFEGGLNALQMFIPEDRGRVRENISKILAGEDLGFTEYTAQRKDGSTFPVIIHSAPIVHESKVVGLRGIIIDISGIKEAERKVRTLSCAVEQSIDGIAIGDLEPKLLYVNEAFARMHGYSAEEMIGMEVVNLHNEEQTDQYKKAINQIKKRGSWTGEIGHIRKDGTSFSTYMSVNLLKDNTGEPTGILALTRDVTEHKRTEEALQVCEESYRTLFEESRDAVYITTRDGRFVDFNKSLLDLFGYSRKELAGLNVQESYVNPADRLRFQQEIEQKGSVRDFELKLRKKDGTAMDCLLTSTVRRDVDGDVLGYQGIIRDITEYKKAEANLLTYQGQLRSLASELSLTEERERRRIATELHDSIGHALALCKIKLGGLRDPLSTTGHAECLDEIYGLIEQAIQSVRSLTFELSPPVLHELGLGAAVEWFAERIQRNYGIPIHVDDDRQPKPLKDDVKILLFQATRELLVNVVKHAHARNARVSLRRDCDDMRISVEDDGVGFDTSEIFSNANNTIGLGLFNIRERLNHIQGNLEIQSGPGHGTRITMVVPLKPEREIANGGPT